MSVKPPPALNSDSSSHSEEQSDEGICPSLPEWTDEEVRAMQDEHYEYEKKHRVVYYSDKDKMALLKLDALELDARAQCGLFLQVMNSQYEEKGASSIGAFITQQLMVRHVSKNGKERLWTKNFKAIRMIVDGLENLIGNRPFKIRSGKPLSPIRQAVWKELTAMNEWDKIKPSLKELRDSLKTKRGIEITAPRLSKIVHELGMVAELSDSRRADSESGKRRRGKRNVSIRTVSKAT
jgi:hypothetical protein